MSTTCDVESGVDSKEDFFVRGLGTYGLTSEAFLDYLNGGPKVWRLRHIYLVNDIVLWYIL